MLVTIYTKQGALLASWNDVFMAIGNLILISVIFFITGLFEEYGWRGYLLPRLSKRYNLKRANFLIGIIVVCYNLPVILILNLHYGITKAIMYALLQSAVIFAMNYAFTYLFTLSQNVILPSIMHTLWNNLNLAILGYSYKLLPSQGYIIGKPQLVNGEGLFGLIFFSIFAIYAYRKFSKAAI
ncbi:MAG: CPBP family intramembrane metalloprotease [Clostridium sp.]|nr:CPBP family intramembrane metalloprotease [Clostridium sp.]